MGPGFSRPHASTCAHTRPIFFDGADSAHEGDNALVEAARGGSRVGWERREAAPHLVPLLRPGEYTGNRDAG